MWDLESWSLPVASPLWASVFPLDIPQRPASLLGASVTSDENSHRRHFRMCVPWDRGRHLGCWGPREAAQGWLWVQTQ